MLRTETDQSDIPDEPMSLWFNFWAVDGNPDQENQGVYYEYWIDDVEVRVPEPASCTVLALGAAWLLRRRGRGAGPSRGQSAARPRPWAR